MLLSLGQHTPAGVSVTKSQTASQGRERSSGLFKKIMRLIKRNGVSPFETT